MLKWMRWDENDKLIREPKSTGPDVNLADELEPEEPVVETPKEESSPPVAQSEKKTTKRGRPKKKAEKPQAAEE